MRVCGSQASQQPLNTRGRAPRGGGGGGGEAAYRAGVVELAAIVGRREDGDQLPVSEELVAVLHDLVRAHHQVEVVLGQELAHDVGAEGVRDAAVVLRPASDVELWVRPQKVAKQPCGARRGRGRLRPTATRRAQPGTAAVQLRSVAARCPGTAGLAGSARGAARGKGAGGTRVAGRGAATAQGAGRGNGAGRLSGAGRPPESGTSVGRLIRLICSGELRSGERPACTQKIFSSTMAAKGKTLKTSWNFFHILMLYLRLHSS